jgi:hypothetical protein
MEKGTNVKESRKKAFVKSFFLNFCVIKQQFCGASKSFRSLLMLSDCSSRCHQSQSTLFLSPSVIDVDL